MLSIEHFDKEAYLDGNPTVRHISTNVTTYLEKYGWNSIAEGKHKFHKDFDYFIESKYLELFSDVKEGINRGDFVSAYDHFRLFGYDEIVRGLRKYLQTSDDTAKENPVKIADKNSFPDKDSETEESIPDIGEESHLEEDASNDHTVKDRVVSEESVSDLDHYEDEHQDEDTSHNQYMIQNFNLSGFFNMELEDMDDIDLIYSYLDQIGYQNIITGKSKFHKNFQVFRQEKYFVHCPDIKEAVENGVLESGLDHFIHYGYQEIIDGGRFWHRDENGQDLEKLRFINYRRKNRKGSDE